MFSFETGFNRLQKIFLLLSNNLKWYVCCYNCFEGEIIMRKDIFMALAVGLFGAAILIVLVMAMPNLFLN
jgi:hypothetical protein